MHFNLFAKKFSHGINQLIMKFRVAFKICSKTRLIWQMRFIDFILTYVKVLLFVVVYSLSCIQLFCDPIDCGLPGSSVHGISQARILVWAAISFFRGSSWAMDWTQVSHIAGRSFTIWATREALLRSYWILQPRKTTGGCHSALARGWR